MRFSTIAVAALLAVANGLLAQPVSDPLPRPKPRPPELTASEDENKPVALSLAKADIRTVIVGYLAETTMTLTFRNDTPRVLEGELAFPLPESATVSGYALDINGVLVDGVPVERQKARITYEKEIRKRVDPGLVEMAVGNNFKTRVYPIPANGTRTIKVQYVSDLTESAEGVNYRLQLNWAQVVTECTIRVEVVRAAAEPVAQPSGPLKLSFRKWEDRFVAEQKLENVKLDDQLVVSLPEAARHPVLVENRIRPRSVDEILAGEAAGERSDYYFVISQEQSSNVRRPSPVSPKPYRVGVLWDASLSRAETDKSRELALLKKVLATVDPAGVVDVVAFRNEPDAVVTFPLAGGIGPILKHLESLVYDGGTNLSKVSAPCVASPGPPEPDRRIDPVAENYWLLFTDGLANLGPEMPAKLEVPVYPVSNDPHSNHALLRRIAAMSGGVYFNLERATDEQVIGGLSQSPYSLISVECNPAEVADVYPHGSQPVLGRVTVTGRLLAPEAKVKLNYGFGGNIVASQEFTLTQKGAAATGLVPRYWAQQKVAELSSDVEGNGDTLAAVGREFNLVTPNTSLLVLETVEQYLQYKIIPPKTSGDVYAQFMTRIEQQKTEQAQTRGERIAAVLNLWNQRVQWWDGEYKYAKDFKYQEQAAVDPGSVAVRRGPAPVPAGAVGQEMPVRDATVAARPEPAPHPAPPASLPPAPRAGSEEVTTVTASTAVRSRQVGGGGGLFGGGGADVPASLKSDSNAIEVAGPSIVIKEWDPAVPYLVAMREAGGDGAYAVYLKQRKNSAASPAFYLDCADYLLKNGQKQMGIRVLTQIAELKLDNAQLLRIVAHKLNQIGDRDLAIDMFEKIKTMRPEEPQSYRDLALALADRAEAALLVTSSTTGTPPADADYGRALELLNTVVMTHWDRFEEIEVTALMEANRIIACLDRLPYKAKFDIPLDLRLVKKLDCDVRIVLTWDADMTDVDLWVTEPSGEKCFFGHNRTTIGAMMSRDFTQGYGPEEYNLRHAMPGLYKVQANYYGSSQASLVGPCTVQATVITDFGRPTEKRQYLTLRLAEARDVVDVGSVTLGMPEMNK